MNILAIDTATARCSVALVTDSGSDVARDDSPGAHSGLVLEMIRRLIGERGISLNDIDLLAVDVGPGSFTGLRIGIGVTQGLAYSQGLPVAGIGSLDALASQEPGKPVIAALDARMGQVYWGVYQCDEELLAPRVSDPGELLEEIQELGLAPDAVGMGNGWHTYPDEMPRQVAAAVLDTDDSLQPDALQVARLAAKLAPDGYLRPQQLIAAYVRNRVAEKSAKPRPGIGQ